MATISAQEFLKGGKKPSLIAPASANNGLSEEKTESGAGRLLGNFAKDTARSLASTALRVTSETNPLAKTFQPFIPESIDTPIGAIEPKYSRDPIKQFKQRGEDLLAALPAPAARAGTQAIKTAGVEAGEQLGRGLIKTGERIQDVVLKPQAIDIKNGFKIENVTKYGLNGRLDEVFSKSSNQIKSLRTELNTIKNELKDVPAVDIPNVLQGLINKFKKDGVKNLGSRKSIEKTIDSIEKELDSILPAWREQPVNFSEAIDIKRAAGLNASFLSGQIKQGLTADEKVWNNFYRILQKETEKIAEKSGNTRFKQVNKALTELIPIEQAVLRRIPVAERNNLISLPDLIAGVSAFADPKALSVGIINRLLRSGTVAKGLIKAGKKIRR